jgi:hypothetical protein
VLCGEKMPGYQLNKWTKSTLATLQFIFDQNSANKKLTFNVLSGTMRNWAYLLKKGDYLTDTDEGIRLTETGKQLLTQIKHNPPERRGKRRKLSRETKSNHDSVAEIHIRSKTQAYDAILTDKQVDELVKYIIDMKNRQ